MHTVHQSIQKITFGSAEGFRTLLTIREPASPKDIYELKFQSTFAAAKDPAGMQTRAQVFVTRVELVLIGEGIQKLVEEKSKNDTEPTCNSGAD